MVDGCEENCWHQMVSNCDVILLICASRSANVGVHTTDIQKDADKPWSCVGCAEQGKDKRTAGSISKLVRLPGFGKLIKQWCPKQSCNSSSVSAAASSQQPLMCFVSFLLRCMKPATHARSNSKLFV